jgi:hypothetical protein
MAETYFSATELGKLARLVNALAIIGAQLIGRHPPDHYQRAHINLRNFRRNNKELLEKIHSMAGESRDESALRLAEDLERMPPDVIQALALARRCLLASAFLGHCIAASDQPHIQTDAPHLDRQLH